MKSNHSNDDALSDLFFWAMVMFIITFVGTCAWATYWPAS